MDKPPRHTLYSGDAAYPGQITAFLNRQAPDKVVVWGNRGWPVAAGQLLALICSAKAPASTLLAVHDLAQQWRHGEQVIISGFHSPVEQEAFEILLRGPGHLIYCPARSLPKRLKSTWRTALDDGRLTILSPFPDSVGRATKETAVYRNRFIAALADAVLIAYAYPGSSTEQLAKEVLGWGKPVYTLPHDSTWPLQSLGVKTLEE